jgi:NADH-quinone oxidoreductase subunit A
MSADYIIVGIMIIVSLAFVGVALFAAYLLRPRRPTNLKQMTYECGELPRGTAWIQYNVKFYLFALIFVVFDVEVIFLFPWAVIYKRLGLFGFVEMAVFIFILIMGLIYAWRKGALKWV